jgi:hypothetical protein
MPAFNGVDVDWRIRKQSKGLIWMVNPGEYKGMNYKQAFVDNRYGEGVVFHCRPAHVQRGGGSVKYRSRLRWESSKIYTRERIKEIIESCKELSEFREDYSSCYNASRLEPDFKELISSLRRKGGTKHKYVYRITDDVLVYYGITDNQTRRERQYRSRNKNVRCNPEAVIILKNRGRFELLTSLLNVNDALNKEQELIQNPERSKVTGNVLICVNISKGGQLGGTEIKWTKEETTKVASLYVLRSDFRKRDPGAYDRAYKNGWLDEVCWHMEPIRESWNLEKVKSVAMLCASRIEFKRRYGSAECAARKNGWMDEVCSHMPRLVRVKWSIEEVKELTERYSTLKEFREIHPNVYTAIKKRGWINETLSHLAREAESWDIDKVKTFAYQCDRRIDLIRLFPRAYDVARSHGWLDEVCEHMQPRVKWKKASIVLEIQAPAASCAA